MLLTCLICGTPFEKHRNSKTCSPKCSAVRTARRQRAYVKAHPVQKRLTEKRYRKAKYRARQSSRMLDRAVRLLFALTSTSEH